jgi:hypothetical protein
MSNSTCLVDLKELRRLVNELDLKDDKHRNEYINARWLKYVEWWDFRARSAKKLYYAVSIATIIGGALIPALVGLRELNVWGSQAWMFSVASIAASLTVAICTGLESVFGFGRIWREKRAAAEMIKCEGFRFLQLAGDYRLPDKGHADLFAIFAENVERIIEAEIKDYVIAIQPKAQNK